MAGLGFFFTTCLGALCGAGFVPSMRRNTSSSDGVGVGVGLLIGEITVSKSAGEKFRLHEGANDALNEISQLVERFDNRLTLKNLALAKRYIWGQLTLHVLYKPLVSLDGKFEPQLCAVFKEQVPFTFGFNSELSRAAREGDLARNPQDIASQRCNCKDGHLMLVSDVGFVEQLQLAPNLVGLDRAQDIYGRLLMRLFYSRETGFQFVGAQNQGEVVLPSICLPSCIGLPPRNIQYRTEIADGISDNGRHPERKTGALINNKLDAPSFLIELSDRRVDVSLKEGSDSGFRIDDVLFGPFDLRSDSLLSREGV